MITLNGRLMNVPLTGIQRYIHEIVKHLPADTFRILTPPDGKGSAYGLAWEQTVVPARMMGQKGLLWSPCNTGPLGIRRQVLTVHDIATMEGAETDTRPYRAAYYAWLFKHLLPRVEGILTVSNYTKQRLIEVFHLPEDNIHVTHLGVDHTRFKPQNAETIHELKTRLKLPENYILFLGALSARKNMARLLEAWKIAQTECPETQLVIAGGGSTPDVFNGTTMHFLPPRTHLAGRVADADVPALLSGAEAFVFPSLYEGFGLPPLEAMACGTPCLTSNVTSVPEIVGNAAQTVSPTNVEEMAHGIVEILTNRKRHAQLREKGLEHAQKFQWQTTATQTLNILAR